MAPGFPRLWKSESSRGDGSRKPQEATGEITTPHCGDPHPHITGAPPVRGLSNLRRARDPLTHLTPSPAPPFCPSTSSRLRPATGSRHNPARGESRRVAPAWQRATLRGRLKEAALLQARPPPPAFPAPARRLRREAQGARGKY